jgi:hypothetical protein
MAVPNVSRTMGTDRILSVWMLVAVLMVLNGAVRELLLVRLVSRGSADVLSGALGLLIVLAATRPFLRPFAGMNRSALMRISVIWLVLTIAFEFGFGHYVDGKSWEALIGNYAIWRGRLWPVVLLTFVSSPFLWARSGKP